MLYEPKVRVPCPVCGDKVVSPTMTMLMQNEPWACSACRAELTGIVHLALPRNAVPGSLDFSATDSRTRRVDVRKTLGVWLAGLHKAVAQVGTLVARLDGPDEEATAHAVMGTDALGESQLSRTAGDVRTLVLADLPAATARRLVETTFAEGPEMKPETLAKLILAREEMQS